MSMREALVSVLEGAPQEFMQLMEKTKPFPLLELYAEGLQHYLLNELPELDRVIDRLRTLQARTRSTELMAELLVTRRSLRTHEVRPQEIARLLKILKAESHPAWRGEILFVLGMAYEQREQYAHARESYLQSAPEYRKAGAHRKAAKAELNAISADSHIHTDQKRHIANFLRVSKTCLKAREFGMAGLALNNVASEYQKVGAHSVALKYSERAMTLLEKDYGTAHYFFGLLQRAGVYLELGRRAEAQRDYEETGTANFPEVIEARKILGSRLEPNQKLRVRSRFLVPTWRYRAQGTARLRDGKLGLLEQKLLSVLARGPKNTHELIIALYDGKGDYLSLQNRFHVLVHRLKRKLPEVLIFDGVRYRLVDDPLLKAAES